MRASIGIFWALILVATALGGCTPRNVVSALFPTKYAVISTVTFEDGGNRSIQTVIHRCKIVDQTGSISMGSGKTVSGDRHWLRRADGSLLILGRLAPCPVDGPDPGFTSTYDPERWRVEEDSYLFDNAERPRSVQVFDTHALFDDGDTRILQAAFEVLPDRPATHTWETAFRGRDTLPPSSSLEKGGGAPLAPGIFVGVTAEVAQLTEESRCESPDNADGPVLLPHDSACRFLNGCRGAGDATSRCGHALGYLPVTVEAGWARARIALGPADTKVRRTLYDARVLLADGAPESAPGPRWTPEICLDGLCVTPTGREDTWLFYYPRERKTVTVMMTFQRFSPDMFKW